MTCYQTPFIQEYIIFRYLFLAFRVIVRIIFIGTFFIYLLQISTNFYRFKRKPRIILFKYYSNIITYFFSDINGSTEYPPTTTTTTLTSKTTTIQIHKPSKNYWPLIVQIFLLALFVSLFVITSYYVSTVIK